MDKQLEWNFLEPEKGFISNFFGDFFIAFIFSLAFFYRNPLRANAVTRFELNKAIPLLERKAYAKAMKELEMALGIPRDISIFQ